MGDRTDPTAKIVNYDGKTQAESGVIDIGDRAKTYVFTEDGPGSIAFIGTDRDGTKDVLQRIARTNDGKTNWGEANNGDGESRKKIDLFDAEGEVSDDFVAMIEAAQRGEGGLGLTVKSTGAIEITVEGRWSTDVLRFEGDFVRQALETADLGGFDLQNRTDQAKVFCFDLEDNRESIYTGGGRDLKDGDGTFSEIFSASFLNDGAELAAVVNAALDEKYGLGETEDMAFVGGDDQSVVIEVTTHHSKADDGMTAKTMILCGSEVEALIAAYDPLARVNNSASVLDVGDNNSRVHHLDTDTDAKLAVIGGGARDDVQLDAAGTATMDDFSPLVVDQTKPWLEDREVDDFVYLALAETGNDDMVVTSGGQMGDDYLVVELTTPNTDKATGHATPAIDTIILEGAVVEQAIDEFYFA
jgi:hypothetical protein